MTVKGGSRPACAACRFQRRRCTADCPLAPYFPANQPKMFQSVHRLFGVGNILKILNQATEEQKPDAMTSIKYESYIREVSPVQGCYGIILHLRQQLKLYSQELLSVQKQLAAYRGQTDHVVQDYKPSMIDRIGGETKKFCYGESSNRNVSDQPYNSCPRVVDNSIDFTRISGPLNDEEREKQCVFDYDKMVFDTFLDDQKPYIYSTDTSCELSLKDTKERKWFEWKDKNLKNEVDCSKLNKLSINPPM